MQAQLLSLHNAQTTLLLSQLLGLSHMMILSMQQPCVLDLSLAMLQFVCQYMYFPDRLDLRYIISQVYTFSQECTSLQSLEQCMDHRGIASGILCKQSRLCQAVQCTETHLRGYIYSHGELPVYVSGIYIVAATSQPHSM